MPQEAAESRQQERRGDRPPPSQEGRARQDATIDLEELGGLQDLGLGALLGELGRVSQHQGGGLMHSEGRTSG